MRKIKDAIGEVSVPDDAAYGSQSARAMQNFPISGRLLRDYPEMIIALAQVKYACARANSSLGSLSQKKADAIAAVCQEIISGQHHEHFLVDMVQGGAGTSSNMNCNEVVANLALKRLGHEFGAFEHLHPNDDVNRSQSTNDAYPTAIRLAILRKSETFLTEHRLLKDAFQKKATEFSGIIKVGRTQLQDAVPMTLGDEFAAFSATLADNIQRVRGTSRLLCEINLGGTAIGTGVNAPRGYRERVVNKLSEISGYELYSADNLVGATYDMGTLVLFSGALKSVAIKLSKIASDLRLLSSGPRAGLGELHLPAVQAGSSIMPGKVNPVIPEVVNQVCYAVIGNDLTVSMAAEAGQLQLNAMEPVLIYRILDSMNLLENAMSVLRTRCVEGIQADEARCQQLFDLSLIMATDLAAVLGYDKVAALAYRAKSEGLALSEAAKLYTDLTDHEIEQALDSKKYLAA